MVPTAREHRQHIAAIEGPESLDPRMDNSKPAEGDDHRNGRDGREVNDDRQRGNALQAVDAEHRDSREERCREGGESRFPLEARGPAAVRWQYRSPRREL